MTKMTKAVAAAVLAMGASAAQAGITIPAGDWTIDIGGNVNAYYTHANTDTSARVGGVRLNTRDADDANTVGTGLLPAALGIGGKTRQNDLDIGFQFTFFTGTSSSGTQSVYNPLGNAGAVTGANGALQGNSINVRQAFLTFGDKSWGTIKAGRDLGIFGSDAILSDMTLLGVGNGSPGGSATLGRIGSGYVYADWKGQFQYASPNWNGFSFAVAVDEPWTNGIAGHDSNNVGFEGKASYEWGGDVSGKVWAGYVTQKHDGDNRAATSSSIPVVGGVNTFDSYTSRGWEIGAKAAVAGFGVVGYYYDGRGLDSQGTGAAALGAVKLLGGLQFLGGQKTDDQGGYVQGTYTIPGIGTKIGASWGISKSESNHRSFAADANNFDIENETWMIGVYHPLTKSLNLVAEYSDNQIDVDRRTAIGKDRVNYDTNQLSLGAILFF